MRVWITGVAGFAGRHLVRHLASAGAAELHGSDHGPIESLPDAEELRAALASYGPLDVTQSEAVEASVRAVRPDAVIHLAAQASGAESFARPVPTYRVNALGSLHLLEAVRAAAPRATVLLVGSADIYGSGVPGGKIREDAAVKPRNPYAASKAAQDQMGEVYAKTYGLSVIRTRTFTHTGPGQRPQFALAGFAEQLARIDAGLAPPEIRVGNLDPVREYGDVRDVVRAYALLLQRGEPGEAYNVCTGRGFVLRDLLDRLRDASGVRAEVTTDPSRLRPQETEQLVGDPSKIHERTGWTPEHTIDQTLSDLFRDARDRVRRESGR